jgi:hypothetical protein
MTKDDITCEAMLIATGMWLLQHPEKDAEDLNVEYLIELNHRVQYTLAKKKGSIH